ncbi:hypothetical protein CVT24_012856, partial [Panaeolus cyanescens]
RHGLDFAIDLKHVKHNKSRKKPKRNAEDPQQDTLRLADNYQHLYTMLDPVTMRKSAKLLELEYNDYIDNHTFWKMSNVGNPSTFINTLAGSSQESLVLDAYIPILSINNPLSACVLDLDLLTEAARFLPQMKHFVHTSPFLKRAIQAEVCSAWIRVYHWNQKNGHQLVSDLLAIHNEHGFDTLARRWPKYAQLVDHIVRFLADCFQRDLESTTIVTSSATLSKHKIDCQHIESMSSKSVLISLQTLPADLYGLIKSTSTSNTISLSPYQQNIKPLKFSHRHNMAKEFIYTTHGPHILLDILSNNIIYPAIQNFDIYTRVKHSARTSTTVETVFQRAVLRGALLDCLQTACGGNAIFFYDGIAPFLHSPTGVFPKPNGNTYSGSDKRMYGSIIKQKADQTKQNLQPFLASLSAIVEQHPSIVRYAATFKRINFQVINGLSVGHRLCDDDIDLPIEESRYNSKPKTPISLQIPSDLPNYRPLANSIVPGTHVGLGTLGLIIREALNHKRSAPVECNEVHQVLLGSNPIQFSGSAPFPLSHTDPIRSFSQYAQIFSTHIPSSLLVTRIGLSNLLSYMGTGQGAGTQLFLNTVTTKATGFFSNSISQMTEDFQTALSYNDAIFGSNPKASKLTGFIHCFDLRVWGQPSKAFSLAPDGRQNFQGIQAKFEPYWADAIQDKWAAFLGSRLNTNPDDWVEPKPTWTDTFHFLVGLQIPGFQTGLTVFQCTNNLALAGLCIRPTTQEIVCWINKNRKLGAWRALKTLGFLIDDKSGHAVYAAFSALYQFLDTNLTDVDKKDIDFGPMFLEHLLCKVSRYNRRWPGFAAHAQTMEKTTLTIQPTTFPFPLILTQDNLQEIFDSMSFT